MPDPAGRRAVWVAFVGATTLALGGCTATVVPPRAVAEPVRVGLLDHGLHASLVVERTGSGMVWYAYGDWRWFALGRTGPLDGVTALLWPTPAALGRKELPGPLSPEILARQVRGGVEHAFIFEVDARDLDKLVIRLDDIFRQNIATLVYNSRVDLEFVRHPDRYSITHNSNHVVADWLEVLRCRVDGPVLLSDWKLERDPAATAHRRRAGAAQGIAAAG